jgi:hypothetical protein
MDTDFSVFVREVLRFWIRSSSVCGLRFMLSTAITPHSRVNKHEEQRTQVTATR